MSYMATLRALATNQAYVLAVLGYAAYSFAVGGLSFWMPIYLNRELGLTLARADILVGAVTVVAGILGTFAGGYIADLLARRMRQGYLYLSGVSMLLAIPAAWVALTSRTPGVYISALFVAEFLVFLSTGPINVVLVSVVPVAIRATAMAVSIFAIHMLGDAFAPFIIGAASDQAGLGRAVLIMPFAIAVSGLIWTGAAWWGARKGHAYAVSIAVARRDRLNVSTISAEIVCGLRLELEAGEVDRPDRPSSAGGRAMPALDQRQRLASIDGREEKRLLTANRETEPDSARRTRQG